MATAWREQVTSNPAVMHGQACIKGTRIPVSVVLGCLAEGMTAEEILADYPTSSLEAISAALGVRRRSQGEPELGPLLSGSPLTYPDRRGAGRLMPKHWMLPSTF
ncbi:MAG: DUF433 domain-containing protein [Candidatus Dormibacteria bacterium]